MTIKPASTGGSLNDNMANAAFEEAKEARAAAGGGRAQSPADAAGMGASPDQAKMAGVNKPGALDQAMTQATAEKDLKQEELYDAIERERNIEDEQLTPEQKEAQKLAESLEGLGSLDNLVQKATEEAFADVTYTADLQLVEEQMESLLPEGAPPKAAEEIKGAFNTYNEMLQDPEQGIAAANAYLVSLQEGENPLINPEVKTETILMSIVNSVDTDPKTAAALTASAIAEGVVDVDGLTMDFLEEQGLINFPESDDDEIPEFGMSKNQMMGILGDSMGELTVEEIGNIIENKVLSDIHQTENLQKTISDPNVSPVLREALQGQLAQIEASGMAAIEQDADDAAAQVMAAGSVLFGGEVRELNDLLSDDGIVSMVDDFLMLDEEDRANSDMFKDNPAFANTMTTVFQNALDAGQDFEEAVGELKAINDENDANTKKEKENMPVNPINGEILKLFGKDGKGLVAEIPEANAFWDEAQNSNAIMQSMNQWPSETIAEFGTWMEANAGVDGAYDEMLEILKDPESSKAFMDVANIDETLKGIHKDDPNANQLLMNTLFGFADGGVIGAGFGENQFTSIPTPPGAAGYLDKLKFDAMGGGREQRESYEKFKDVLDANGDGVQDSPEQLKKNIAKFMKGGGMEDMMASATSLSSARDSAQKEVNSTSDAPFPGGESSISVRNDLLSNGLMKGGKLDVDALIKWASGQNKNSKYLESIIAAIPGGIPGGSKNLSSTLGKEIDRLATEEFEGTQGDAFSTMSEYMSDPKRSSKGKEVRANHRKNKKRVKIAEKALADYIAAAKRDGRTMDGNQYAALQRNVTQYKKDRDGWSGKKALDKYNSENADQITSGMENTLKTLTDWEANGSPAQKRKAKAMKKEYKRRGWM
jgi:hypothetical protein